MPSDIDLAELLKKALFSRGYAHGRYYVKIEMESLHDLSLIHRQLVRIKESSNLDSKASSVLRSPRFLLLAFINRIVVGIEQKESLKDAVCNAFRLIRMHLKRDLK